jgi:hypothetical protein
MSHFIIGEPISCTIDTYPVGAATGTVFDAVLDFNNGQSKSLQVSVQSIRLVESSLFYKKGNYIINLSIKSQKFYLTLEKQIFGKFLNQIRILLLN